MMYAVTGATGQLGQLVIDALLETVPANQIVAAVRDPEKAHTMAAKDVQVRLADYDRPGTFKSALVDVDRVLLISGNEVGKRLAQHKVVLDASKAADVNLLVYTSMLHADTTPAHLAIEHLETEAAIAESGIPSAILRNGWYTENKTSALAAAMEHGAMSGCAGNGLFSSASRQDFAAAAAAVLTGQGHEGQTYELAGDDAFTMDALAAEVSRVSGKNVNYIDLSETDYKAILVGLGLPGALASILANADVAATENHLFDDGRTLSRLLGRPTTPWSETVNQDLAHLGIVHHVERD